MTIEEKLKKQLELSEFALPGEGLTVMALSSEGQVLAQLGTKKKDEDLHGMGVLLAGVWQASRALNSFLEEGEKEDFKLGYSNSSTGYLILPPNSINPQILWAFLFEGQLNPGKIRYLATRLRNLFEEVVLLEDTEKAEEEFLFKNVTEDEVDELFSFAGI